MDDVQSALVEVASEIQKLGVKLDKVEADVEAARSREDKDEVVALRTKEEQLRREKEQLRAKELLLLQGVLASLVRVEARSVGILLMQLVRRPARAANERDWRGCSRGKASTAASGGEGVTQQFRAAQDVGQVPVFGHC